MKKQPLIIILFLQSLLGLSQGTWVQQSSFPSMGRENAVAFSNDDNGYIGTGNNGGTKFRDFWEYNITNDTWTQKADFMDSARTGAIGMGIGDNGYVGTGVTSSNMRNDFFEYNPGSDNWTQKTSFAGTIRQDAVAFHIGSKGYLGTGSQGASPYYKDFWEYNPANDTWTQKADLPGRERKSAIGFGIGNKGYIALGFSNLGDYRNEVYEYRQTNNSWIRLDDFPGLSREHAVSFGVDALGRGYVMCGYKALSIYLTDCWEFIQATQEWKQLPVFAGAGRSGAVGFAVNGTAYVGLGKDASGNYLTDFWSLQLPTGVAEINNDFSRMFPSPVHNELTIEIDAQQAMLSLYDLSGKKVNETNMVRGKNIIQLATLPEGSYIYKIQSISDKKVSSGKILKVE